MGRGIRGRSRAVCAALLVAAAPAAVGAESGAAPPAGADRGALLEAGARADRASPPHRLTEALAALGPRPPGGEAHRRAAELLQAEMAAAGLTAIEVRQLPAGPTGGQPLRNLHGRLAGAGEGRIVLSAHYDSVAGSPGAADDAAGCAVVLAAAADLTRTPLRRSVEVILFDGEESGLLGSRAWLRGLGREGEEEILAGVNLELPGLRAAGPGVILTFPTERRGRLRVAPGWLVHAALRAGEATGLQLRLADPDWSLPVQVGMRFARLDFRFDSDAFIAAGIPSLTFSDASASSFDPAYHSAEDLTERLDARRLDHWARTVAATVRRLDALAGRPAPEDRYLVVAGRVWLRRDLYWLGFALWALLVVRGLPGRWRGASAAERRSQGRSYLPGFLFRLSLLLALLAAPVEALPLLGPAALAALARPRGRRGVLLAAAAGVAPAAVLAALLAWGATAGMVTGLRAEPAAAIAIPLCLALFLWELRSGYRELRSG